MQPCAFLFVALFALGACASPPRTLSYSAGWPDADVTVGHQRYQLWFHETDSTVLIQRGWPRPLGQLLAWNTTVNAAARSPAEPDWRAAGNAVLLQIGCEVGDVAGAEQLREASYVCAPGVDIGQALALHRDQWRQGVHVD